MQNCNYTCGAFSVSLSDVWLTVYSPFGHAHYRATSTLTRCAPDFVALTDAAPQNVRGASLRSFIMICFELCNIEDAAVVIEKMCTVRSHEQVYLECKCVALTTVTFGLIRLEPQSWNFRSVLHAVTFVDRKILLDFKHAQLVGLVPQSQCRNCATDG